APTAKTVKPDGIILEWLNDDQGSEVVRNYRLLFQSQDSDIWKEISTSDSQKQILIENLPSATPFRFKVQSVDKICLSAFSDVSEWISTAQETELSDEVKILVANLKSNTAGVGRLAGYDMTLTLEKNLSLSEAIAIRNGLKLNSNLETLEIKPKDISMECLEEVVASLKTNNNIFGIEFSGSGPICTQTLLTARSAQYLSNLIETTRTGVISLRGRNIDDQWAVLIATTLRRNQSVENLGLTESQIGDEGAKALGKMLAVNRTVNFLALNRNQITDMGAKALAQGLKQNTTLKYLYLNENVVSEMSEGGRAIQEAKSERLAVYWTSR
ncbi:unnamed protein product, partial [Didymodactylos carnosus]